MPLDERQTEELWLTSAQSLFAAIVIVDLRFSRREALMLASLFLGQFLFTSTEVRYGFTAAYLVLGAALLVQGGGVRGRQFLAILLGRPHPGAEPA